MNLTFTKGYRIRKNSYPDLKEVAQYIDDISEVTALRRRAINDANFEEADRYTTAIECMQLYLIYIHRNTVKEEGE